MTNKALRKAAILIASLETESADALLDEMSAEQAALVRNAVMDLGEIEPHEQQDALEEFVKRSPRATSHLGSGVEVDPELARKFGQPTEESVPQPTLGCVEPDAVPERPFGFLDEIDSQELARILADEHPQTTAIVIAHLVASRAADVLRHLPRPRQTDALMRIARLTTPHPDVIRDLEQELRSLLAHQGHREQVAAAGLATVEAILQNASTDERHDLVAELSQQDRSLVRRLRISAPAHPTDASAAASAETNSMRDGNARRNEEAGREAGGDPSRSRHRDAQSRMNLDFTDLEGLDNSALAQIIHRSSPNTTLVALAGASHQFVKRILSQLPSREATQLERKIQQIGPIRLDDVQRAQQQMAEVAQYLVDEGTLTLPAKGRFAVAA